VAISKFLTERDREEYRVYVQLSRTYNGRARLNIQKLLPLSQHQGHIWLPGDGPLSENIVEDFILNFKEIAKSFQGLEMALAQPFRNLVSLPTYGERFIHDIYHESNLRYKPEREGDFLFVKNMLSYCYG